VGGYKILLVADRDNARILRDLHVVWVVLKEALTLSRGVGLDLVMSYDPLKTGLMGVLIKKIFRCKLIVEVNGVYNSYAIRRYVMNTNVLKYYLYPKIQQAVIRRADGLKCLFGRQLEGFDVPKHAKLHSFFDFTDIEAARNICSGSREVLSIGFPSYIKGMDLLVAAFVDIKEEFPGWRLTIIGHFSKNEINKLRQLIGDNDNVMIQKPVKFSQIPKAIDGCDIFVLASRSEAMGRVLVEAMARGKARLGARVEGIPSVINHDEDGVLFEANNIDALKEGLRTLMGSEPLRRRLARAGLERFQNEFVVSKYGEHMRALLYDVMQCRSK